MTKLYEAKIARAKVKPTEVDSSIADLVQRKHDAYAAANDLRLHNEQLDAQVISVLRNPKGLSELDIGRLGDLLCW
ncbi:hypothetical protein [Corallococcus carmarthensis]|uniref:hypothetical protein n=1 Tax=Corallococcus carmarthensis TaxID=2316728 RepID=UPI0011C4A75D|nr:hypothetical protein [Corallococcus carmarthensis]NOK18531.1 hypothetical protein [Corallococcus carmarthensis]